MTKSLYYIECECRKNIVFPNVTIKEGEILYYNSKASSNEMHYFNPLINLNSEVINNVSKYRGIGTRSYLPFTRKKQNAKKWEIKRYAENIARFINKLGEFHAVIKEIKVTYKEEEI